MMSVPSVTQLPMVHGRIEQRLHCNSRPASDISPKCVRYPDAEATHFVWGRL